MPRGGNRPGAGRKKGSTSAKPNRIHPTAKARALAYGALESDETPLQTMLEAMRFFVSEARRIRQLDGMAEIRAHPAETNGGSPKVEVRTAHSMYLAAAECARKAAPFVHPQLSSVEHKVNAEFEAAVLSLDEAARQANDVDDDEDAPSKGH